MSTGKLFSITDLEVLQRIVAEAWSAGADRDWSAKAGTLEWTCRDTADHAVDTVLAPAMFLASRRTDHYPDLGWGEFRMGPDATPERLVEGLEIAVRILIGVVATADPEVRAVIWRRPAPETRPPADFIPRAGLELIIHAHDVCSGLGVAFEPPAELCRRLRDHTRDWPTWAMRHGLGSSDDAWGDLLEGYDRPRTGGTPESP